LFVSPMLPLAPKKHGEIHNEVNIKRKKIKYRDL
jgi:hypothetical protein